MLRRQGIGTFETRQHPADCGIDFVDVLAGRGPRRPRFLQDLAKRIFDGAQGLALAFGDALRCEKIVERAARSAEQLGHGRRVGVRVAHPIDPIDQLGGGAGGGRVRVSVDERARQQLNDEVSLAAWDLAHHRARQVQAGFGASFGASDQRKAHAEFPAPTASGSTHAGGNISSIRA